MKVCIVGNGLTALTLAKTLVNRGIYVDIFFDSKTIKINKNRTLAISKSNIEFFNKNIANIDRFLWKINNIEIYSEQLDNKKILNFQNNNNYLFSIIKNQKLLNYLQSVLKKNKFIKFKKVMIKPDLLMKKYNLIFNCDPNSKILKKYIYKSINKSYKSYAHTAIINHKKFTNNNTATQTFTKNGPLAFLPISETETSVVYSCRGKKIIELENSIKKFNTKYSILGVDKSSNFELKLSNLRSYRYKNILAFGDLLHRLHPLAGQGFNMSIRDIQVILKLINNNIELGLELDKSIFINFEKETKHKNFIFSNGIDFVYEFFSFESKINTKILSQSVKLLGNNRFLNKFFTKFADNGIAN